MTETALATRFHQAMLDTYREALKVGYRATRLLQLVNERGGVETARLIVAQGDPTDGFTTLWDKGRLDLAVEALILKPEFASLFSEEERAKARARLADANYTAPWDQPSGGFPPSPAARAGGPSLVDRLSRAVANTQGGGTAPPDAGSEPLPSQPETTGVAAGIPGQEQIRIALQTMADQGGSATIQQIYTAVEARMGGAALSAAGRASLRYFINNVAVKAGYIYPHDPASPGWRITPAGRDLLALPAEQQQATLDEVYDADDADDATEPADAPVVASLTEWRAPLSSQHPLVRRALDDYPAWLLQTFGDQLTLRFYSYRPELGSFIGGRWQHFVAFNQTRPLYALIDGLTEEDLAQLRAGLSDPSTLKKREYASKTGHRFFIETEADYALLKEMVTRTVSRATGGEQPPPPEPLDGPAFVVTHKADRPPVQILGRSYEYSDGAGGAPRQLTNALHAWQAGGPPVYLIIYRPGPYYSFAGWARVTDLQEAHDPLANETRYRLSYEWRPFPLPVSARKLEGELAWLSKGLGVAFRGFSIRPVPADDVQRIAQRAYSLTGDGMTIADAAFTILSRAGGGPLHLSDILDRVQAEGLAELRGQTPQLSLASILLRDERFRNLGKNTWVLAAPQEPDDEDGDVAVVAVDIPEPPTREPAIYAEEDARFWRIHFPRELWPAARRHGVIGVGWPLGDTNISVRKFHQIAVGDRVIAYVQGGTIGGVGAVTHAFDPENPRAGVPDDVAGEEFTQCIRVAWADAPANPAPLLEALRFWRYQKLYFRVKTPNTVIQLQRDDYTDLLSLLQVDDAGVPRSQSRLPNVWAQLAPYLGLARALGDRRLDAAMLQEAARAIDPPPAEPLDADDLVAELLQLRLIAADGPTRYRARPYVAGDDVALLRLCALALLVPLEGVADQYTLPAKTTLPRLRAADGPQPAERFAPELGEADSVTLAGWYAEAGLIDVDGDSWSPLASAFEPLPGADEATEEYNLFLRTLLADSAGELPTDLPHVAADAPLPPVDNLDSRLRELGQDLLFDSAVIRRVYRSLLAGRHVVLSGPPGTGKTELARLLPTLLWGEAAQTFSRLTDSLDKAPVEQITEQRHGYAPVIVTATEDWGVRDVVGGIGPRLDGQSGALSYAIEHGALTRVVLQHYEGTDGGRKLPAAPSGFARRDHRHEGRRYRGTWLVIDEFTRAPIDAAFGSLLTTLSGSQRARLTVPTASNELREAPLPRDFRIIGTLNSFDRHFLNQISEAMKRRFDFIDVLPPPPAYADFEQGIAAKEALRRLAEDQFDRVTVAGSPPAYRWPGVLRAEPTEDGAGLRRYRYEPEAPAVAAALTSFWRLFSAIRVFRQLGTAQVIAVYLNLLTGARVGMPWDEALDTALADALADQLQVLTRDEQQIIEAFVDHAGAPERFARALQAILAKVPAGRRPALRAALREADQLRSDERASDISLEETPLSDAQIGRVFDAGAPLALPAVSVFRRRLRDLAGERGL